MLQNDKSGSAEGWEKDSSIFSHSDICLDTNNIEEEEGEEQK